MQSATQAIANYTKRALKYLRSLSCGKVFLIFLVVGLTTHASGLLGQFQGDDQYQIVNNAAIRSIGNIGNFFTAGTFYNGTQLTGTFYRPLMTTVFSFIYTAFGPTPFAFHIIQLGFVIGSAFLLYLLLGVRLKKECAFIAGLIFLIHPVTSQIAFSIPCMQDALYMFFGLLALLLLARHQNAKATIWAIVCALLALFSKETAIIFIAVMGAYAVLFKHPYAKRLLIALAAVSLGYIALRTNAVGLIHNSSTLSPITNASLATRLLTIPSIIVFYLLKLAVPAPLSTSYYWTITAPTVAGFVLPLAVCALFIAALIWAGKKIKLANRMHFNWYILFLLFIALSLLLHSQMIPLDMTASETWTYPLLVGIIGVVALFLTSIRMPKIIAAYIPIIVLVVVLIFSTLTFLRGFDYKSQLTLYSHDLAINQSNFLAQNNVAQSLADQHDYVGAKEHALRSIALHPNATNYSNLGAAEQYSGDYTAAENAYQKALQYDSFDAIYENLALVKFSRHSGANNIAFFKSALQKYPRSAKIWLYLALEQADMGDPEAKQSITKAAQLTAIPQQLYAAIATHQHVSFQVPNTNRTITIK